MATTIYVRRNGPYRVESDGEVKVVDWNGNAYTFERLPIALCRCGASANKPFCDRTHSKIGFQAAEAAVGPEAADKPAG